MSFSHPQLLLLALTLPAILALYILRRRRRERLVSSTMLWRQATAELNANRPWQRLRRHLLLWLQLLAAALLTLAAAGPVWYHSGAPEETIVLLDASASMQGTDVSPDRFTAACRAIVAEAASLKPGATMTVIVFGQRPRVVVQEATDAASVRQALAGLRPEAGGADLGPALSLATALAREAETARFLLVSDGGVTIPAGAPPLEYLAVAGEGNNIALTGLTLRQLPQGQAALVTVQNFAKQPVSGQVLLRAAAVEADGQTFALEPGATAHLLWEGLPAGGPVTAELKPDDPASNSLALDDSFWAVPQTERQVQALLVTEGNMFLERALSLLTNLSVYRVTPAAYQQMLATAYPYELTVLDGVAAGTELPPGAVLLINPPEGLNFYGAVCGPAYRPAELQAVPGSPFLAYVDLAEIQLARARSLTLGQGWQADIMSGSSPLLAHREEGGGRRLALLAADLFASDLPLRPSFPILLQNIVSWLLPPLLEAPREALTGQEIKLAALPLAEEIVVSGADGRQVLLAPPFPPAPFITDTPGLYRLTQSWGRQDGEPEARATALFAVNAYRATEADLSPREPVRAGSEDGGSNGEAVLTRSEPVRSHHLGGFFCLLALLLILVEWRAACRGY